MTSWKVPESHEDSVAAHSPRRPSCSSTCSSRPTSSASRSRTGTCYGNLIDILKNGAPIMLLAIGMTLVIATHGIDISVGSVVAISAGVVAILIGGDLARSSQVPDHRGDDRSRAGMLRSGHVERDAGLADRHAADHRHPDPLRRGPRHRHGVHERHGRLALREAIRPPGPGLCSGSAVLDIHRGLPPALDASFSPGRTAAGMFIEAVGINPTAARFSGINAKNIIFWVYTFSGFCAGISGLDRVLHRHERRREQRGKPVTSWTPSWPSCWAAPP